MSIQSNPVERCLNQLQDHQFVRQLGEFYKKFPDMDFGIKPKSINFNEESMETSVPKFIYNLAIGAFKAVDLTFQGVGSLVSLPTFGLRRDVRVGFRVVGIGAGIAAACGVGLSLGVGAVSIKIGLLACKCIAKAGRKLNDRYLKPLYNNYLERAGRAIATAANAAFEGIVAASVATKNAVVNTAKWLWTKALKPVGKAVAAGAFIAAEAGLKALDYTSAGVVATVAPIVAIAYGIVTLPVNAVVVGITKHQISKGMVPAGETTPSEAFKTSLFKATRALVETVSSKGLEPFRFSKLIRTYFQINSSNSET